MSDASNQSRRTLSIVAENPDGNETERHYNVDNIAYLRNVEIQLKPRVLVLITFAAVTAGFLVGLYDLWIGVFVAIAVWVYAFFKIRSGDILTIGTISQTDTLRASNQNSIERSFKEISSEIISVSGEYDTNYKVYEYRYHFVPDNIVNIDVGEKSPIIGYLIFAINIIAFLAFGFSAMNIETGMLATGDFSVTLSQFYVPVGSLVILILGLILLLSVDPINVLKFNMQGGDQRVFEMSPTDADYIIEAFRMR
ncbi:MAG: hypothetical protein ABEH59_09170 [Halobacteriales archaeon]